MDEIIELTFQTEAGVIDCRLEPQRNGAELSYSATILYPNTNNGFGRSEIYCHNLVQDAKTNDYIFETGDDSIHPKIKKLEARISKAIANSIRKGA